MKGKKIKATLLIAIFILSTLAIAINVSADPDLTVLLSQPGIEFATGDTSTPPNMPEWTTTAPEGFSGDYCVEATAATDRLQAVVAYGKPLSTLLRLTKLIVSQLVLDVEWNVYWGPDNGLQPSVVLLLDTTGDGEVDACVVGDPLCIYGGGPLSYLAWNRGYKSVESPNWQIRDVDDNNILISGTYGGPYNEEGSTGGYAVSLNGLGEEDEWEIPGADPMVLYIGHTNINDDDTVYFDDIIIGGVTYAFEASFVEDTVTVSGTSTTPGGPIEVYWDSVKTWDGTAGLLESDYAVGYSYSIDITIPEGIVGDHYVIVKDVEAPETSSAILIIEPAIVLEPTAGVVGDTITVTGTGFAADSEITIVTDPVIVTVPLPVPTDEFGSFTCKFDIVTDMADSELVTASDTSSNEATAYLDVGTVLTLTPKIGLVGSTVAVEGKGFPLSGTVDIRWYLEAEYYVTLVDDHAIDEDGEFTTTFDVPLVQEPGAPGKDYTIAAYVADAEEAVATFTVVKEASITLTPDEGDAGDPFTVDGEWFTDSSTVTITFDGTELVTDVSTNTLGEFAAADLEVPDLEPDDYTVTATDAEDVIASETYTILPLPAIVIETRATEYSPGDTVSFYINSTTGDYDLEIVVDDATGHTFTTLDPVLYDMDGWYGVLYAASSFEIPSDYEEGIWNWTARDITPDPDVELATGEFSVLEEAIEAQLMLTYEPEIVYMYETVTVTVEAESAPVASATVSITDADGVVSSLMSNALGECSFEADVAGDWTVSASKTGYTDADPILVTVLEPLPITEISLSVGMNLISLPLIPTDPSIEVVLADVLESVNIVWSYDAGWTSYNPDPAAPSFLTEMVDGKGYWMDMSAAAVLAVDGTEWPVDPMAPLPEYTVVEGWNLMGFKSTTPMTMEYYLLGVEWASVLEYVDGYNSIAPTENMVPGRGYWIAVSEPGTIYPK